MNTYTIYETDLHNEIRYIKLIYVYLICSNARMVSVFTLMYIHGNV